MAICATRSLECASMKVLGYVAEIGWYGWHKKNGVIHLHPVHPALGNRWFGIIAIQVDNSTGTLLPRC